MLTRTPIRLLAFVLCSWLLASVTAGQPRNGDQGVGAGAVRRIGTNLRAFGIPFSVSDPGERYVEVQLYMSRDRGQSWSFHSRQPARATEFPFESRGDGEYWFAIRTLDRDRQLHPAGTMRPELVVTVDTVQPTLDFRIQTDASGRITCRWRAEDEHIDPKATRIAFRPLVATNDAANEWLSVPYQPVTEPVDSVFSDQYAWWPEPRSAEVLVQLAVSDIAGNQAIEERQIALPFNGPAAGQTGRSLPGPASANNGTFGTGSGLFEVSSSTQSPGPEGMSVQRPALEAVTSPSPDQATQPLLYGSTDQLAATPAAGSGSAPAPTVFWNSTTAGGNGRVPVLASGQPQAPDQRPWLTGGPEPSSPHLADHGAGGSGIGSQGDPQSVVATPVSAGPQPAPLLEPASTGPSQVLPGIGAEGVPPQNPWPASSAQETSRMSSIRYVNSRRFRLDYSLESLDPAQISKVVLWTTSDQGQTWTAWAEDTDNESPFPVEMNEPGLVGFRIVFHTSDGLAGRAPARGDDADVWIAIDLEPPVARLTGAPYGRGSEAGHLVIAWEASDAMLRNGPVRLSWSTGRDGPWTLIGDGIDNHFQYAWKPDAQVPDRVYIRLDVTDAAGNVATSTTGQPVDLRGLIPRGRIIDVQPVR